MFISIVKLAMEEKRKKGKKHVSMRAAYKASDSSRGQEQEIRNTNVRNSYDYSNTQVIIGLYYRYMQIGYGCVTGLEMYAKCNGVWMCYRAGDVCKM